MTSAKFKWWNPIGTAVELIEAWTPVGCATEKDYERSLYQHLHAELGGVQVTRQFASGRIRADIVVGSRVLIELKHNLDTTAKHQRLVGQLEDHREWKGDIVVVLLGETDQYFRKKLDAYAGKRSEFLGPEMRVLQK